MSHPASSFAARAVLVVITSLSGGFAQEVEPSFAQQGSTPGKQRFVFTGDASGIGVRHEHGLLSCCLVFSARVEREGTTLRLTEDDGGVPCGCADVHWDVSIRLPGLEPDTYEVFLEAQSGHLLAAAEVTVPATETAVFVRGAVNDDDSVNVADAIRMLDFLYVGGAAPPCLDAADVNDDGAVNISDPIYLLDYLFLGGPAPDEPFSSPGEDPTEDAIACDLASRVVATDFTRDGDFNGDGVRSLTDGVAFLNFLRLGGPPPACEDSVDMNDDGVLDMGDLCGFGPPFCPSPLGLDSPPTTVVCGPDATPDRLGCEGHGCGETP